MTDGYCNTCSHPHGYHKDGKCSMPVVPGTNCPISRNDTSSERCKCGVKKTIILIEYRERQMGSGDVIAHVSSTWPLAEKWIKENSDYGGNDPTSWFWWIGEEVIDSESPMEGPIEQHIYEPNGIRIEEWG